MSELGVYIHYPWCRKRCSYCDFAIAIAADIPHRAYRDAVIAELAARAPAFEGRSLATVYFGGGTPGLWPPEELAAVIAAVRARFPGVPREITLEVNPTDCTPAALRGWLDAGIDRLSIGVQSFDADELVTLGRDHRFGDGAAAVAAARAAGFARLSCDFILGTPGRARAAGATEPSVVAGAELDVGHLSVYELTYEPRAPLSARVGRGELAPLPDDAIAELYAATHRDLEARGFEHYEVSSYARPGHRAIHNALYWRGTEYLGLGNSAASLSRAPDGSAQRVTNLRSVRAYLAAPPDARVAERDELTAEELAVELVWLGLRTCDGVAEPEHPRLRRVLDGLVADGLAERAGGAVRPTLRGFLYADQVARRVVAG